jgi:hypothetical protein
MKKKCNGKSRRVRKKMKTISAKTQLGMQHASKSKAIA